MLGVMETVSEAANLDPKAFAQIIEEKRNRIFEGRHI